MPKRRTLHRSILALFVLALPVCLVGARTAADSQSTDHAGAGARDVTTRKPALYLEVQANVRGALRGPFVPEMTLAPRAQIVVQARTSSLAHVYMLHCDAHAALSVFPDAGGIDFRADQWVSLPAADMPIHAGAEPGYETVYVVATREPLAQSDALLERLLAEQTQQPQAARCDGRLDALLAGSSMQPTAARKLPYALRGVDISKPNSTVARAFAQEGIVVLRFGYSVRAQAASE